MDQKTCNKYKTVRKTVRKNRRNDTDYTRKIVRKLNKIQLEKARKNKTFIDIQDDSDEFVFITSSIRTVNIVDDEFPCGNCWYHGFPCMNCELDTLFPAKSSQCTYVDIDWVPMATELSMYTGMYTFDF